MSEGRAASNPRSSLHLDPRTTDAVSEQNWEEWEEAALVAEVRRGNRAAYEELVRRHLPRAYKVAYRVMGNRQDAEDLVQDAFLVALEKIDQCKPGLPFGPWFYRILVNQGLNLRKSLARRSGPEVPENEPSRLLTPERETEQQETRTRVRAAMEQLPDTQRTIVELFELEGFSGKEIADIMDMAPGTVRWHLHQAKQTLRTLLEPLWMATKS